MAYRLLENLSRRDLENAPSSRILEGAVILLVSPDFFSATAISKTQSFLNATAQVKICDPFMAIATPLTQSVFGATAIIKTCDPFTAISRLRGST